MWSNESQRLCGHICFRTWVETFKQTVEVWEVLQVLEPIFRAHLIAVVSIPVPDVVPIFFRISVHLVFNLIILLILILLVAPPGWLPCVLKGCCLLLLLSSLFLSSLHSPFFFWRFYRICVRILIILSTSSFLVNVLNLVVFGVFGDEILESLCHLVLKCICLIFCDL